MSSGLIKCSHLEIGYGRGLMPPFDLNINKGDFLVVAGPNGAGKSTLIKTILGIIPPVSGTIIFPDRKPVFGYVPQQKNIASDHPVTAFETVIMGKYGRKLFMKITGKEKDEALESMKKTGTDHLKDLRFSSLSGGQKQKVLMARAIYSNPDIMILDEPTQGMDIKGEKDIISILEALNRSSGITIILISHQLNTVSEIVRKLIKMDEKGIREEK